MAEYSLPCRALDPGQAARDGDRQPVPPHWRPDQKHDHQRRSGGHAWLGIGAGWNEEEARGLGVIGAVAHVERITPLEAIGREVIPAVADL